MSSSGEQNITSSAHRLLPCRLLINYHHGIYLTCLIHVYTLLLYYIFPTNIFVGTIYVKLLQSVLYFCKLQYLGKLLLSDRSGWWINIVYFGHGKMNQLLPFCKWLTYRLFTFCWDRVFMWGVHQGSARHGESVLSSHKYTCLCLECNRSASRFWRSAADLLCLEDGKWSRSDIGQLAQ